MTLNQQQILALAPDDASAKAGTQLAAPNSWGLRCAHALAVWGECQGSGKLPYRTAIDLTDIAFKCSCPSKKFPCKHGIALLLLYAEKPNVFTVETTLVPEVEEWLAKRAGKNAGKDAPNVSQSKKTVDEVAQQKRIDAREKKVSDGISELQTWLKDVVRTGIKNVPQNPYQFVANIIPRMIDAQATGLAYQLKKINKINFFTDGWQSELTQILAKTFVISEAYKNKNQLDLSQREDLDALIGWTKNKDIVLNATGIKDDWLVLSKTTEEEDKLTTETVWLFGMKHREFAQLLNFYGFGTSSDVLLTEGTMMEGELVFYPSAQPMRAIVKTQRIKSEILPPIIGFRSVDNIKLRFVDIVARSPFIDRVPFIVSDFRLMRTQAHWFLIDDKEKGLGVLNNDAENWLILSITQGKPFTSFCLLENGKLRIMGVWFEQKYYSI